MSSNVPGKIRRHLPGFLNQGDPVVQMMTGASQTVLEDAETALSAAHQVAAILGAEGSDLDFVASVYGLTRLPNETDAHLLGRIGLVADPPVSPNGIQAHLQALSEQATFYEPAGGSLVGWDPRKSWRYDRSTVSATFARSSIAFGPDGAEYASGDPTFEAQGSMWWAGVFEATTNIVLNSRFLVTSGSPALPTAWTATPASGGTIAIGSPGPYAGNTVTFSNTTQGASAGTLSQDVGAISQAPYTLSAYVSGAITLEAYAENSSGTPDTAVSVTSSDTGDQLITVTYTPSAGFVDNFTVTLSGYGSVYAVQAEELPYATPIYPNDATTAGSTATRSAETLTIPAGNILGAQEQGLIAIAFEAGKYGPLTNAASTRTSYLLDWQGSFAVYLTGDTWTALIGGAALTAAASPVAGLNLLVLDWNQTAASLWLNGAKIASGTITAPSSISGTAYLGSNSSGTDRLNAYFGNLMCLEAWWPDSRIASLSASVANPVYAQSLWTGAFFSKALAGIVGGMSHGVANYVGVFSPVNTASGFVLGQGALDVTAIGSSPPLMPIVAEGLFAAGKFLFPWTPGDPT